jgi:CRISPR/Cas system-associated exonuclease Cas4 (RecB family)
MDYAANARAGATLLQEVADAQEQKTQRLEGPHVTDIVFCRRKGWYRLHGYEAAPREADVNLQMLLGTAFGALLEEQRHSEVPVELSTRFTVVHGTIDILEVSPDGEPVRVVEIKESRSSSAKPLAMLGYYLEQVATYCLATGIPDARLHICHLLGDYKGPKRPVFNTWDIRFSEQELLAWRLEVEDRAAQLVAPEPPPALYSHWSFECEGCAYQKICPGGQGYEMGWFIPREELIAWQ